MSIQQYLIDGLGSYFGGKDVWGQVQAFVHIADNDTLTGEQKRKQVVERLQQAGVDLAMFLLHLLIELAVTKLRSR